LNFVDLYVLRELWRPTIVSVLPGLSTADMVANLLEAEHNVPTQASQSSARRRRPDMSTFFSAYEQVDTSGTNNPNAVPVPAMMSAVYREALEGMEQIVGSNENQELPEQMLEFLRQSMEAPPKEVKGVSDQFITGNDHAYRGKGSSDALQILIEYRKNR
jgi:hypothetical protein